VTPQEDLPTEVLELQARILELEQKVNRLSPAEWAQIEQRNNYQAAHADRMAKSCVDAAQWALAEGYTELDGSVKQIQWAMTLRKQIVGELRAIPDMIFVRDAEAFLRRVKDAKIWIELRPDTVYIKLDIIERLHDGILNGKLPEIDKVLADYYGRLECHQARGTRKLPRPGYHPAS
jgi:hypothetical protein